MNPVEIYVVSPWPSGSPVGSSKDTPARHPSIGLWSGTSPPRCLPPPSRSTAPRRREPTSRCRRPTVQLAGTSACARTRTSCGQSWDGKRAGGGCARCSAATSSGARRAMMRGRPVRTTLRPAMRLKVYPLVLAALCALGLAPGAGAQPLPLPGAGRPPGRREPAGGAGGPGRGAEPGASGQVGRRRDSRSGPGHALNVTACDGRLHQEPLAHGWCTTTSS